ncbi:MAG: ATP-binding cassette domain-containing protein [Pseudomonadota bacterium]
MSEELGRIRPGEATEESVDAGQARAARFPAFRLLFQEVPSRHFPSLFFILIAACLSNAMMLLQPLFVMIVYDRVIPHGAFETLWALATGVLLGFALDLMLRKVRIRLENAVAIKTSIDLQERLFARLVNGQARQTPAAAAEWTDTFREIDTVSAIVPALWASLLVDIPFVFAVLALVYAIAGNVVLAPLAGIAILGAWTVIGSILIRRAGARVAGSQAERTELLSEAASLSRVIKFAGAQSRIHGRFHWLLAEALEPLHDLRRHSAMQMQLTNFMVQGVIVAAVVIGVYKIDAGAMSIGALVATMLLVSRVLMPAGQFVLLATRTAEMAAPLRRILRLLELPQEEAAETRLPRTVETGRISLKNVSLWHPGGGQPALKEVSLEIEPGEKIALIGQSGSGKSTLLQLLVRLHDADEGHHLVDGHNARQYAPQELRRHIAYMGQESELFDGTIFDNLMVGRQDADEGAINRALMLAGAFDFIRQSPAGLSQRVGKRGQALSGGERQAVCLARSLLQPSKMLLLDEPTSSMDQNMEGQVLAGLKAMGPEKTIVIATHRAQILSAVDRIIWMHGGCIMADGPSGEVLAKLQATGPRSAA